jgi:hypothetical protein
MAYGYASHLRLASTFAALAAPGSFCFLFLGMPIYALGDDGLSLSICRQCAVRHGIDLADSA